jgi:EmrB/QacA subfamily drug resistance transporter
MTTNVTIKSQEKGFGNGISRNQALLTFGIVGLALIMSSIDSTIVAVSLPTILDELKTNLAYLGWIITGYQFSQCIMMPIIGKLSDEWGRKQLFLTAVAVFTVSSIAAGFSPNIYCLIIFRIIQGAGAGAFFPSATGIISDSFGSKRGTAIGLFGSIFPIGGIIGPNIGGVIIDNLSWRWIFFVNIPIGVLLIILGLFILPRGKPVLSKRSVDYAGAGLFSGSVLAVLYAMTDWADNPQGDRILTWALFAVGAVLLALFLRHERRVEQPLINLDLLRRRPFAASNAYNFFFGAAVFGPSAFIPYYATLAYGMTAGESGIILTPRSIAMIAVSAVTSIFIIRFRYRLPMILGAVIMALGFFLLSRGFHDVSFLGLGPPNLVLLALIVMLGGIGMGLANPASNNALLDLAPEKVAAVMGMRGMFRMTGGIFGTAVMVLALSHFDDKAVGLQQIVLFFAVILVLLIPVIFLIPDTARERRDRFDTGSEATTLTE